MVDFLKDKPTTEIVKRLEGGFSPVIDGQYLTEEPMTSLKAGRFQKVPIVLGFTKHEGTGFVFDIAQNTQVGDYETAVKVVNETVKVRFFRGNPNADAIVDAILNEYNIKEMVGNPDKLTEALVDMYGDLFFVMPAFAMADLHSSRFFVLQG